MGPYDKENDRINLICPFRNQKYEVFNKKYNFFGSLSKPRSMARTKTGVINF